MSAILSHLYLIRAQVDLAIAAAEAGADGPAIVAGACPHPDEKRYDATTGGDGPPKWICGVCLQTFEGALP